MNWLETVWKTNFIQSVIITIEANREYTDMKNCRLFLFA